MTDLRLPTGYLFAILGAILTVAGLAGGYTAPLTTVNVNLYTGLVMLAFAGVMLWLAQRRK
jgi:hypothetical protein